ncbi:MAG TPA: hypothetical protein VMJ10_11940 [Kofleriaceae bacterium]|nr:hypothetical protein [Kofleriaceae bacterium]
MRGASLLAVALAASGCGKLFGIERIPYAAPDASSSDDATPTDEFTLEIQLTGGESGAVTINTGAQLLECSAANPGPCHAMFPFGTTLALAPMPPDPSSRFVVWRDACLGQNYNDTGGSSTCTLTPTDTTQHTITVTAQFESSTPTWIVLIPDDGTPPDGQSTIASQQFMPTPDTVCNSPDLCVLQLDTSQEVIMTATPDPTCATFAGWRFLNIFCSLTDPMCIFSALMAPPVITFNYKFTSTGPCM